MCHGLLHVFSQTEDIVAILKQVDKSMMRIIVHHEKGVKKLACARQTVGKPANAHECFSKETHEKQPCNQTGHAMPHTDTF